MYELKEGCWSTLFEKSLSKKTPFCEFWGGAGLIRLLNTMICSAVCTARGFPNFSAARNIGKGASFLKKLSTKLRQRIKKYLRFSEELARSM